MDVHVPKALAEISSTAMPGGKNVGFGITLFEKTIRAFENQDFDLLKSIHHEDFMFVREFSMYSRDEHLASIAEWLPNANWHDHAQCVHEDDFVLIMR